jgi:hypothetical protein
MFYLLTSAIAGKINDMSNRLIDLHKEWLEWDRIFDRKDDSYGMGGLCNSVPIKYQDDLIKFRPTEYKTYWASGFSQDKGGHAAMYNYNTLRQTIVLLICAMNNEL